MKYNLLGKPYFLSQGAPNQYKWLDHDIECDVAIIGGGIAGAMCAYKFSKAGISVAVVSAEPVGYGATAAAQGVVSRHIEGGLTGLAADIGIDEAANIYGMINAAVNITEGICNELSCDYNSRDTFYYEKPDKTINDFMNNEFLALKHNGYDVELVSSDTADEKFSFPVGSGIIMKNGGLECDPYKLTHALLKSAEENGAEIYENTEIHTIDDDGENKLLYTPLGHTIKAKRVIIAAGTMSVRQIRSRPYVMTSFSVVTSPVEELVGWQNNSLIANNNVKMRTTNDNRIIISGLDCSIVRIIPTEKIASKKYKELVCILKEMFPAIRDIVPEYTHAYEYLKCDNSLPIIGEEESSGIYYSICPGENGIAFSVIAADLLVAHYLGRTSPVLSQFSKCL